ncbi:MAG: hypothetical protein P9M06_00350 [Candidatus Saelkia tenebricola]|nr:hypothetical protein [Candidatus Saelkia tenebricola]
MRIVLKKVFIVGLLFIITGCNLSPSELGRSLEYKGSDLYYTDTVTETEARVLGDYLSDTGFFKEDNPGTTQIRKEDDVYQLRMVVKEGTADDIDFLNNAAMFAAHISKDVFNGTQVEMHLCNKDLETIRVATYNLVD